MDEKDIFNQEEEQNETKLFANKKLNTILMIVGGIIVVASIAAFIWAIIPS
jgi:flagellar basal body-associated protein FliL